MKKYSSSVTKGFCSFFVAWFGVASFHDTGSWLDYYFGAIVKTNALRLDTAIIDW